MVQQFDYPKTETTLEYSGQIIKLSDYDKPSNLGVTITKRGNAQALAGSQMRYDITMANTSNVALSEFYWHDRRRRRRFGGKVCVQAMQQQLTK